LEIENKRLREHEKAREHFLKTLESRMRKTEEENDSSASVIAKL